MPTKCGFELHPHASRVLLTAKYRNGNRLYCYATDWHECNIVFLSRTVVIQIMVFFLKPERETSGSTFRTQVVPEK